MIAIQTRYLGATNFKPARVVATGGPLRAVMSWDDGMDSDANHAAAAAALCLRMGWNNARVSGTLPNGDMAHVLIPR